ncbi:MAG: hypothetical protein M3O74_13890 [Pseudomonadota bacterium]|nr:hypothetical protein [Pseudomonadota bacterium]
MKTILARLAAIVAASLACVSAHADDTQFVGYWTCTLQGNAIDYAFYENGSFLRHFVLHAKGVDLTVYNQGAWASGKTQLIITSKAMRVDNVQGNTQGWEALGKDAQSIWFKYSELSPNTFNMLSVMSANSDMSKVSHEHGDGPFACIRNPQLASAFAHLMRR